MIRITISGTEIYGKMDTKLTSGSVGRVVEFTFDSAWDGLFKTVVFRVGDDSRSCYLGDNTMCEFPWELLTHDKVGKLIHIGVCGMRDEKIVFPTMYTYVGKLEQGADPNADPSIEHSPELVEQLIEIAEEAKEIAQSVRDDLDSGDYGGGGADGYSPIAKVEETINGAIITITDKNGTTTATITDGKDGAQGPQGPQGKDGASIAVENVSESTADGGSNVITFSDGKTVTVKNGSSGSKGDKGDTGLPGSNGLDGYSPTVTVSKSGKITTIKITDKNGTKTATINDGGDGASGKDGYTPIRGTDYWTEADKAEIKSYVDDAILGGAW